MASQDNLDLGGITTPAFVVDIDIVKRNALKMAERCRQHKVNLRPHMKTHKTLELGEIMTAGSKRCIVVSTLAEAEFFADGGFDDILYAFPFTADKIPRLQALVKRLASFHVLLDSDYALDTLLSNPAAGNKKWSVFLKVDCGYHRAGVPWDSEFGVSLARRLHKEEGIVFQGIYTHEGLSYSAHGEEQIREAGGLSAEKLTAFSSRLEDENIPCPVIATGSTPTCSKPDKKMLQVTEFHPGNYIFYDVQQYLIGSCGVEDIAVAVATRVIGAYPHRNQLLIDCGWLGLSLDGPGSIPGGSYCLVKGEANLRLVSLKQEAGILEPVEGKINFEDYPLGSVLYLLPHHSCATAAMHGVYYITSGGKIIDRWQPCRGW